MKYWVFDLDGTLINSAHSYFSILEKEFKIELSSTEKNEAIAMSAIQFLKRYIDVDELPAAIQKLHQFSSERINEIQTFEGMTDVLTHLRIRSKGMAVWTNRDRVSTLELVKHKNWENYFDHIVTSSCVTNPKPHTEGLEKICSQFGCNPNDIVVVGDHDMDMIGAKNHGSKAIRANWHRYNGPVPEDYTCRLSDHHFHGVLDFRSWVESQIIE